MLISRSRSMGVLSCFKCFLFCLFLLLRACVGVKVDNYNISFAANTLPSTYFEIDTANSRLIVGATNQVFNLDFELTTRTNDVEYDATKTGEHSTCIYEYGFDEKKCHNLLHLVKKTSGSGQIFGDDNVTYVFDDLVLMCSSHAYNPECIYRRISDLQPVKRFTATGYIPSEANPPLPALLLEGNALISAPDLLSVDRPYKTLVARSTTPFIPINGSLHTVRGLIEENWFIEPNFVSINEIGDYIYIFFRERAKEQGRNVYYSRVARVCKNDTGTLHHGRLTFTTFEKARITCDRGTHVTYFYDEIQDTYYSEEEQLLYAIFTSSRYGPLGSALCTYSFNQSENDLFRVFEGKFFNQTGLNTLIPTNVRGNFGCERSLKDALDYQLIMNRTRPVSTTPLVRQDGYSFRRMVPPIPVNGHDVLFITASKKSESDLYVMKYVKEQAESTYTLVQEIPLPNNLDTSYVTRMVLYGNGTEAHIFIGTSNGIYRIPVQSCADYTASCSSCMTSGDPYCFFDSDSTSKGGECSAVLVSGNTSDVRQTVAEASLCAEPLTTDKVISYIATKTASEGPKYPQPTVDPLGLGSSQVDELKGNVWIIVGSVCGFVGGAVIGVVISALFRRYIIGRSKYRFSSVDSSCELADGSRNNSNVTIAPLKLHSVIVNPTETPRQDQLMNNSTTSDKNFTHSSENDYSHPPEKSAGGTDTCKKLPPSPPMKSYPSVSPTKSSESDDSGIIGTAKCSDMCTPSPKVFTVPLSTKSTPPQSSGYRQQGTIFKFDPTSIKMNSSGETSEMAAARRSTEPNVASGSSTPPRRGTDPNLKSNYRQNVHLTNQQRQNYGRNILARYPSIDGSKSKYLPNGDASPRPPMEKRPPPPPVRPKPSRQLSTKTVLELDDGDVGSSLC